MLPDNATASSAVVPVGVVSSDRTRKWQTSSARRTSGHHRLSVAAPARWTGTPQRCAAACLSLAAKCAYSLSVVPPVELQL
jgi:hypothetical protein